MAESDGAVLGVTEPRIYTPPLPINCNKQGNILPDRTDGHSAIRFAKELLHLNLFPWQEWLLIHALELIKDDYGRDIPRFRIVIVEVGRQNGKTVIDIVLALWHLFVLGSKTVIGTAQDLSKADDTWREVVAYAESDEDLRELVDPNLIFLGHPKTFTLTTGAEYRVASATRRGGRGFSGDLILMDELREHHDWDSWSAVTNTMNARPRAQCWAFSNAGDFMSVVLRYQRALAHRSLGWPDGEREFDGVLDEVDAEVFSMMSEMDDLRPGWFEWSAAPTAKRNDLHALAQSNPSLNHVEVTDNCPTTRTLLYALGSRPAYEYETEVMCRWATMGVGGPFPEGSWEGTLNAEARPDSEVKPVVCVEVSARRNQTYVARAGVKKDGTVVVGIRYDHPGTEWVVESLSKDSANTSSVIVRSDAGGSTLTLLEQLQRELRGVDVVEWKAADINIAHGQLFDRLRDRTIEHLPHHGLDTAATSAVEATKPGGGWTVDIRKSPSDVAPLYAVIGAVWGLHKITANQYNILESIM